MGEPTLWEPHKPAQLLELTPRDTFPQVTPFTEPEPGLRLLSLSTKDEPTPAEPVKVPGVDAHPIVIWAAIMAAVSVMLAHAIARAVGPVSEAIQRWREHKQASEDARIVDLSGQVDHLAGRVFTLEQRQQRQDRYLFEHAQWDRKILAAAIRLGLDDTDDLGTPPPLWPPVD